MFNKTQFLIGGGFPTDTSENFEHYISMYIVSKSDAIKEDVYTELKYNWKSALAAVKTSAWGEYEDISSEVEALKKNGILGEFMMPDLQPNAFHHFIENTEGLHRLGGEIPHELTIPENTCPNSLQYVGKISCSDSVFEWLPFDLHLICPIYLGFDKLWLDMKDPLKPKIINKEELAKAYTDNILKPNTSVVFEKKHFSLKKEKGSGYGMGFSGVPRWTKNELPPICPESNQMLRFVCQLNSNAGVKTRSFELNDQLEEPDLYLGYFKEMAFAVDQQLYVFFQPETKIACLRITY